MIRKLLSFKNIGRFQSYAAVGDTEFRQLTMIFGENGHGKTTLAAVLRSLQSGEPSHITERKTLNADGAPEARVLLESGTATFAGGAWSTRVAGIEVFDETFIHRNVYAGDCVGHEQKKNLYRVIVGEQGVHLADQVDGLDGRIRDANKAIADKKQAVARCAPAGMDTDDFIAIAAVEEAIAKIAAAEAELDALKHADEIRGMGLLQELILPDLPSDFRAILGQEVSDLSATAAERVHHHLRHRLKGTGESWVVQGLGHLDAANCPFCGQDASASDLLAAYQNFFGEGYQVLKAASARLALAVDAAFGDRTVIAIQKLSANNDHLGRLWQRFLTFDAPTLAFEDVRVALAAVCAAASALAQRKATCPLEPVEPGEAFERAWERYATARTALDTYNTAVRRVNVLLVAKKAATEIGNTEEILKRLAQLRAAARRREPEVDACCCEYTAAAQTKKTLDREKKAAKQKLDEYTAAIFDRYQTGLNSLLGKFNAGFRIDKTSRSYVGGTPSSSYVLVINDTPVDIGDGKANPGGPSFKTALSSGDRSTLALAFFLVRLAHDPDLPQKVVVFDDPITSQDLFRAACTRMEICRVAGRAKQVIVLSHNQHFLKHLWDNTVRRDAKTLCIRRSAQGSSLLEWDVDADTQGEYFQNYRLLSQHLERGHSDLRQVARCIRLLLEEYLRLKAPNEFRPTEWLGDFIAKIRKAKPGTPLVGAQVILQELDDINAYAKKYHHAENPGSDREPINDVELQAFVRRTLALVGRF